MAASVQIEGRVCVESDGSKKLKADLPAGYADYIFRKSPASGKADERPSMAILLTGRSVS
jgi:hypothetical protein